jgi:hypothetical protein
MFSDLAGLTEERWRREGYREAALPDVALRVFDELSPHRHLPVDELVGALLAVPRLPPQSYGSVDQRIVIPHHGRRFYLEVIFWVDEVAFPHHHSFSGAFHVLSGLRLHTRHRFEEERPVTAAFRLGRLSLEAAELLETGASRAIHAGDGFIHSLSHIDRPSVSLVIATDDPAGEPQLNYKPPHVAHAARHGDHVLAAQLRALELLADVDPARHVETLRREVARADLHSSFELLRHGFAAVDAVAFADLVAATGAPHELAAVFAEERRRLWFLQRRGETSRDARLLQALLLHVPSRRAILDLLRRRTPDPASWLATHVADLDLPFDDEAVAVLRQLLAGAPPDDPDLAAALADAPLLSSLFCP